MVGGREQILNSLLKNPDSFRVCFLRTIWGCLGLAKLGYLPYSLRRGGAADFFRTTGSLERTAVRGRWTNVRTARFYLDEAARQLRETRIPPECSQLIDEHYVRCSTWLA